MNPARKPLIAGNWKMNLDTAGASRLAAEVAAVFGQQQAVEVLLCPTFVHLAGVAKVVAGSYIRVGAQDVCFEKSVKGGAFTGEVAAAMLKDVGCTHVIIGHSERRHLPWTAETNETINKKIKATLEDGLTPIFCVGERLSERDANQTQAVVDKQLVEGLVGIGAADMAKIVIAYEPVWAINTGRTATPAQAQEACAFIRGRIGGLYDVPTAAAVRIQYGGSVKPDNAKDLLALADVDGALVGGASLKSADFGAIVKAAQG